MTAIYQTISSLYKAGDMVSSRSSSRMMRARASARSQPVRLLNADKGRAGSRGHRRQRSILGIKLDLGNDLAWKTSARVISTSSAR
jgi:hypothetical protein